MVAALTRIFGLHNLALAEDVVQDAFCRALEVWKFQGVPENSSAWLMRTARNRAIDVLRRERRMRPFAPELDGLLESEWTLVPTVDELFTASAVKDDQLRMMFSCCDPRLREQAQVALILHMVCGFSVAEIASAFLSGQAAIEKRISRAKKVLARSKRLFDLTDRDFQVRLSAVQRALYLLFNEGYHGASPESAVRTELCAEAMRLIALLMDQPVTATPSTHALHALMCLNGARLPARIDSDGNLTTLYYQDRSQWNRPLLAKGLRSLDLSATGSELSEYHVEAAIAAVHAGASGVGETDWERIVALYDQLMTIRQTPVVALNRAIAIAQHQGPARGLEEIRAIPDRERLAGYPFYEAALGELELRAGNIQAARAHFEGARSLARNPMERTFMQQRIDVCQPSRKN